MCLSLKLADETIGKFTLAQPTVHVPEGFEDYLLVKKNYQLHDNDTQSANEEVICGLFMYLCCCLRSFFYLFTVLN